MEADDLLVIDGREGLVCGDEIRRDCEQLAPLIHPTRRITPMGFGRPSDRTQEGSVGSFCPNDFQILATAQNCYSLWQGDSAIHSTGRRPSPRRPLYAAPCRSFFRPCLDRAGSDSRPLCRHSLSLCLSLRALCLSLCPLCLIS